MFFKTFCCFFFDKGLKCSDSWWQTVANGPTLYHKAIKMSPQSATEVCPTAGFYILNNPIQLTAPIGCAATLFLPLACIIIHLLKYVIFLFHLWACTCSQAKPQLPPESYCRQRKHSVALLFPVQSVCPTGCLPWKAVCFWLCAIILQLARNFSELKESPFLKTWIQFKRNYNVACQSYIVA